MSQRTIVEFNHDQAHRIVKDGQLFLGLLERALKSGAVEDWKPLESFGVRRAVQRHHTERCRVVVGTDAFKREHVLL